MVTSIIKANKPKSISRSRIRKGKSVNIWGIVTRVIHVCHCNGDRLIHIH